ncbi:DUF982 domain-containing protein [Pararhizobium sp. DWP1-1-3]|uniref:DUF982 domain-containing protein n=1 Tax=Pararhizobium sp. DWP1-1-3 TaxID=2804652 RepID=UPI003CEBB65E
MLEHTDHTSGPLPLSTPKRFSSLARLAARRPMVPVIVICRNVWVRCVVPDIHINPIDYTSQILAPRRRDTLEAHSKILGEDFARVQSAQSCRAAIAGRKDAEEAREIFIVAAKEANLLH